MNRYSQSVPLLTPPRDPPSPSKNQSLPPHQALRPPTLFPKDLPLTTSPKAAPLTPHHQDETVPEGVQSLERPGITAQLAHLRDALNARRRVIRQTIVGAPVAVNAIPAAAPISIPPLSRLHLTPMGSHPTNYLDAATMATMMKTSQRGSTMKKQNTT